MKTTVALVIATALLGWSVNVKSESSDHREHNIKPYEPVSYTSESYGKDKNYMLVLNGKEVGFRLMDMMCIPDSEGWDKEFNTKIWVNGEEIPSVMKCMKFGEAMVVPSVDYKLHVMREFINHKYVSVEFMIDGHHVYSLNR